MTDVKNGKLHIYLDKGKYRNAKMDVFVVVEKLEGLHASGGSDVEMNLEVEKLECHLSGGSDTDLEGSAEHLHIQSSGSSDFEGFGLVSKHCIIRASGSSDSKVNVSESIEVSASGSSDVHFKGNPSKTNIKSSGSSDVHSH